MHHFSRTMVFSFGLLALGGCQDFTPADPYLGTIDGSAFDPLFRGGTTGCLAPRRGFGAGTGLDAVSWYYLGALSRTQIDISNATDLARTAPTAAYEVKGCVVHDERPFDARLDNFVKTAQYPVLLNPAPEPTTAATYKPWHVVVPVSVRPGREIGCNDVRSQRSVEARGGWDRERKVYGSGDFDAAMLANAPYGYVLPDNATTPGLDLLVTPPTRDDIRTGKVKFRDWPMVNVAMPLMKTTSNQQSCPLATGSSARYPRFPGDTAADFQFPQGAWLRGLLSGYLDGGDLPFTTDAMKCPAMVSTGKSCPMATECDMAKGEVCSAGKCLGRLPICPVINDVYVPMDEVMLLGAGTRELMDGNGKRTADVLAIFSATPGQPGYSPVCRLRLYDPSKLTCGRKEAETVAPRPLCSAAEIAATPGAVPAAADSYIHCLFPMAQK